MKNKYVKLSLALAAWLLAEFLIFYVTLPPLNFYSKDFWGYLIFSVALLAVALGLALFRDTFFQINRDKNGKTAVKLLLHKTLAGKIFIGVLGGLVLLLILGGIVSSTAFNARRYASVIEVNERDFATDMPKTNEVTNIALLDTDSARILGTRKLGELADVVSQFIVSENYTQINYHSIPKKVASLEYDGFFKWLNNKGTGIPGYIMVDAVNNYAEYVKLPEGEGIRYTESALFGQDLERALRFAYPTKIFGNISFEVDEEGHPYYIVPCMKPRVALFGALDVSEVVLFDPVDGSHELIALGEVPRWVDIVYHGDLVCQKYDWQGTLAGGFINSLFAKRGCKQTTDDFGYLMLDDDVWYFTGVTSVSEDASNIGFILSNARTGEYKYYPVNGAEEHSAMAAAEGEVQEKRYVASFPALVNIANEPSYIMVLKDAGGLVKLYALVNVEQYNIVATGETQAEAIAAYTRLLAQAGIDTSDASSAVTETVTVEEVRFLSADGGVTVYLTGTPEGGSRTLYKMSFREEAEELLLLRAGDSITLTSLPTGKDAVREIFEFSVN